MKKIASNKNYLNLKKKAEELEKIRLRKGSEDEHKAVLSMLKDLENFFKYGHPNGEEIDIAEGALVDLSNRIFTPGASWGVS